jgi:hypothetical protein
MKVYNQDSHISPLSHEKKVFFIVGDPMLKNMFSNIKLTDIGLVINQIYELMKVITG